MYIFMAFVTFFVLCLCMNYASKTNYEASFSKKAILRLPADDHNGGKIAEVSLLKSFGGEHSDHVLKDFPLSGNAFVIGFVSDECYKMISEDICHVYLNGVLCEAWEYYPLKTNDLIEVHDPLGNKVWRLEFQRSF